MSRISGQIDRNTSSASAGETKRAASRRSVSRRKRLAAAGAARVGAGPVTEGGDSSVSARALLPALVEDRLLFRRQLVERRVRLLGAGDRRVDLGRVDVEELGVLGQVPEVLQPRNRVGEHLVVRLGLEELR